jgi:anti-sigma B factor antagonist
MTLTDAQSTLPTDALVASLSTEDDATVLALRGEADLFTLPAIVDVLARVIADHDGPVVIDLADIAFIDTASIRAVARTAAFLRHRGRELTLRSPSRIAARVLTLLELSPLIEPVKATTLLDRPTLASTFDQPTPLAPLLAAAVADEPAGPAANPTHHTPNTAEWRRP